MKKLLLLAILMYCGTITTLAQQTFPGKHSYYIELKDAAAKTKIEQLTGLVQSKQSVTFFNHYRAARPFFVLLSGNPVSNQVFAEWIKPLGLELVRFEEKVITAEFIKARRLEKQPGQKADKPSGRKN